MKATEMRQPKKSSGECDEVITATTASLSLSASPATVPARWAGRFSKLPLQLQHFLLPLITEPDLVKLRNGEIRKSFVSVPQIGTFKLECKGNEIYVTFLNTLFVAYQLLQMLRLRAIAVRYHTIAKSSQGGYWVWLPQQRIFPPEFCILFEFKHVTLGLLQQRSPPPWKNDLSLVCVIDTPLFVGTRFITPAVPRAERAPTFMLPAGAVR